MITVVKDVFNSEIFKIKMGNLIYEGTVHGEDLLRCIADAKEEGYQHLSYKIPTSDKKSVNIVEDAGFRITDTLITYTFDFNKNHLTDNKYICTMGDCRAEDVEELKRISKESFKTDRFHSDPCLPNELCDMYYEKWFENSYNGFADKVMVAYYNGRPVGYTTGKYKAGDEHVRLVLSAVNGECRGMGIYTSLIHAMTEWAMATAEGNDTTKGILLGTQIDNIAVQKAWSKLGYSPYGSDYVMQIAFN